MMSELVINSVEMLFATLRLDELRYFLISVKEDSGPFGVDTSIEGLKSQEVSVGIFYFLVASIIVFTIFVFMYMFKSKSSLKLGEKILFIWILFGVVVAVIFGASQMLHGYLF